MKPVARVRWSPGARSAAGFAEAHAATLRGRFEQLLHGTGQGLPGVAQTPLSSGAPPPSAGCSAGLDALVTPPPPTTEWTLAASADTTLRTIDVALAPAAARDKTLQNERLCAPAPVAAAAERSQPPQSAARQAGPATAGDAPADDATPAATTPPRVVQPPAPAALASLLAQQLPAPQAIAPLWAAATPSPDAALLERATPAAVSRTADNIEPVAVLPLPQAAPTVWTDVQAQPQQPAARPQAARGQPDDLPALVRDLVQAVVHLSRGREGQWRLTMALKPRVLDGTLVALEAQPGRLRVRFDCTGADAGARLAAVRDDLRLRLVEALSAARPVDVSVDVQMPSQAITLDHV
jgi:hypothetical protein